MNDVFVHTSSIVETRQIGPGTRIWGFTHIMKDVTIGSNCNIGEHCFVESHVAVGNNVTIKNGNMLWEGVVLEDGVFVGPNVFFTNDRHPRSPRLPQARRRYSNRNWLLTTRIKQGASIGAGAIVYPGITVGEFSSIAPGSVVTRDVPPYALVSGSPARRRGWVCQCGQTLRLRERKAHCRDCDLSYERRSAQLCLAVPAPRARQLPAAAVHSLASL